jgi:hypothetical protein
LTSLLVFLLLAAWTWDRPLLDCFGFPESLAYYRFRATMRETISYPCLDDQGQPSVCTATVPGSPMPFGPQIPDPGVGTSVSTFFDPVEDPDLLPTPAIGALLAWPWPSFPDNPAPVVAVDTAGNSSGVCP